MLMMILHCVYVRESWQALDECVVSLCPIACGPRLTLGTTKQQSARPHHDDTTRLLSCVHARARARTTPDQRPASSSRTPRIAIIHDVGAGGASGRARACSHVALPNVCVRERVARPSPLACVCKEWVVCICKRVYMRSDNDDISFVRAARHTDGW